MSCSAMKEESPENQTVCSSNDELNLDLAYGYAGSFIAQCDKNIDDLNTRLTTFLGFAGVLLRFSLSLPTGYPAGVLLRVLVLSLSALAICQSGYALAAHGIGSTIKPSVLMSDEWFSKENIRVKASMTKSWLDTIEELEGVLKKKTTQLNRTIGLLSAAACAFAISEIIVTVFPV